MLLGLGIQRLGFPIVVRRSAVLVSSPMFSLDIAFGHTRCGFVEDALC